MNIFSKLPFDWVSRALDIILTLLEIAKWWLGI
jgi:hypothetical protein